MPEKMSQSKMLELLQRDHQEWVALLAEVGRQRMTVPGLPGGWSVQDVIAHISWFEREMVGMLKARALVGSELWNLPQDERNGQIYQENKDRPLEDVLGEAQLVFEQLLQEVAALPVENLNDPALFPGMPADWVPWEIIAQNSYEHYQHHVGAIRKWLKAVTISAFNA
jgi:hypothetical protein